MKAAIYSDTGLVEFPVTHVGVTIDGDVQIMGDTADGRPFSIVIQGRDSAGRDLVTMLTTARAAVREHIETEGQDMNHSIYQVVGNGPIAGEKLHKNQLVMIGKDGKAYAALPFPDQLRERERRNLSPFTTPSAGSP